MIRGCRLCADRFAATATAYALRRVAWFRPSARLLIAGLAQGVWVHASGRPFTDPGGDRLRGCPGRMPAQKPHKVVAIALANRMAKALRAMPRTGEAWRAA
jgi:hypothetical protein